MLDEVLNIDLQSTTQLTAMEPVVEATRTDEFLVRSVLDGDETAFAEIFERYKRPVTRTAGRFFKERADIEECVQKAFTKAYFSLSKFRGAEERSLSSWLTRITVNVCYDEFRRRRKSGESLLTELSDDENDYLERVLDGHSVSVEKRLIAEQLAEKVLAHLDPQDRVALTLVYSEDHTLADVAETLGISVSNLKSRLFRCRNSIKTRFQHLLK